MLSGRRRNNGMLLTRIIFVLLVSCEVFGDAPFSNMSYPDAIAEAKSSGKLVMIDFYTTWCGPCKMLDKTTWKDEKVQQWLKEKTIPLKVDAEKLRPVATKFNVSSYPTIVFLNGDEEVVGRFVGYKPPEKFIGAAENAIAGVTELSIARKKFKENPNDPMHRNTLAGELVREHRYKEALEHYSWCWKNGLEKNPTFSGVRVSFMLGAMERLAKKYPPAADALNEWGVIAKTKFESEDADRQSCTDYFALEKSLGATSEKLLQMFDGLNERGDKGKEIKSWVGYYVKDELFAKERFAEFLELENVDRHVRFLSMFEHMKYPEGSKELLRKMQIEGAMLTFEACIALDRDEDATRLLEAIIKFESSDGTVAKLQEIANKRKRAEYIATIQTVASQITD